MSAKWRRTPAYARIPSDAPALNVVHRVSSDGLCNNWVTLWTSDRVTVHPLGSTFDSSDTSSSDAPTESDFGEVQSVTTFDSSETLNDDVLDDELCRPEEKDGLLFVNAEAFPHSISGKKAKLAFTSSLQKNGNMSQVDIDSRYVETPLCHERKGLIELPKLVRKEIWHKAIVHNQKLLVCSC